MAKKKVSNKSFFKRYIFILLSFFLIVVTFLFFVTNKQNKITEEQNNNYTQYDGTTTLYNNPKSDITFSYPSQLHVTEAKTDTTPNAEVITLLRSNESFYSLGGDAEGKFSENNMIVNFEVYNNPSKLTPSQFLSQQYGRQLTDVQEINTPIPATVMCTCGTLSKYVVLPFNGKLYSFQLTGGINQDGKYSEKVESLFEKMIQSIKLR